MSELKHWTSDGATEAEAKLLDAARGGGPSAAARARMAGALGVGVATSLGSGAAAGAGGAAKAATAVAPLTLVTVAKWALVVAAVGTTIGVVAWQSQRASAPLTNPPTGVSTNPPRPLAASTETAPPTIIAPPPIENPMHAGMQPAVSSARPAAVVRSGLAADGPSPSAAPVDMELALLEQAKAALDAHRPGDSLAIVADYERRHPRGVFTIEAKVIRIEALHAARRMPEARQAAEMFLRSSPNAAQAARIRSLLREIDGGP